MPSYWSKRPKHTKDHVLHFTGRGNKSEGARTKELTKQGAAVELSRLPGDWHFYWHCEQCQWYFAEYSVSPGRFRPYTEAWESDLDIMCKGCATGSKTLMPTYETSKYVD